jgi:AdoMet-dependent rRNA methyltransferase SPB1
MHPVAKEQGLRSRAAFKLVQINRKYPLLEKCGTAVLDLCAAPGGWTQIVARTVPRSCRVVAVDVLPIRPILGSTSSSSSGSESQQHQRQRQVTTLIGDITTPSCQADIRRTLQTHCGTNIVDLVLHDGAPNVGAEYGKDAYEQNELALHALKCATSHLKRGGSFVTKLYRSVDYAKYLYVLNQLFDKVHAFKPKASRLQSAEIFLIALGYKAPETLDPRFLDPKHVFRSVEGDTTGGGGSNNNADAGARQAADIFSNAKPSSRPNRQGYDLDFFEPLTLRHTEPVAAFCSASTPFKEAVAMLGRCTSLEWDDNSRDLYWNHPLTTDEVRSCLADLRVLNRSDFKGLLAWRNQMQLYLEQAHDSKKSSKKVSGNDDDDDESASSMSSSDDEDGRGAEKNSDQEEEEVQAEIAELQKKRQRERKRQRKKERAVASKRRKRAALNGAGGVDDLESLLPEHDKIFSLATLSSAGELDAAAEVNLDRVSDEMFTGGSDDEDIVLGGETDLTKGVSATDSEERWKLREKELDDAYAMYLQTTKNGLAKTGTKMAKRSKKLQRIKVAQEAAEDQEMALATPAGIDYDTKVYADLLRGPRDSDEDDNDSSAEDDGGSENDDGFHDPPVLPEEHAIVNVNKNGASNPLIRAFNDEPASAKTSRWFSNPLFATIGQAAQSASTARSKPAQSSSDGGDESLTVPIKKTKGGLDADEVLASIPKTDKQQRHQRRLKQRSREERKKARRAERVGEEEEQFEIAPADGEDSSGDEADNLKHLSEAQKAKVVQARELIKAGMGKLSDDNNGSDVENSNRIEVVPQGSSGLTIMDTRKYDSDHEAYDSDDYAQTLALGTMMLRRSKEKAFVDASYNRYAWNDPEGLPEWFVDDENRHYRPQLPIPPALLAKIKEKMMALSTKPIAKVAEARARKNKRAKAKLAAAKKQAEAVANNPDMSEAMKLKAISKALRGQETRKPSKTYVVAKKGRTSKYAKKGVKMVDRRMKSDKRGMERKEKRGRKRGR